MSKKKPNRFEEVQKLQSALSVAVEALLAANLTLLESGTPDNIAAWRMAAEAYKAAKENVDTAGPLEAADIWSQDPFADPFGDVINADIEDLFF